MTTKLAKHTPGPWRRGQEGNLRIYGPDGQAGDSGLIAEVFPKSGAQTANARLIAAAPAMLEALIELNTELNLDALANHFPVAEAVVGKIKAAIRAGVGAQEENTQ